MCLDFKHINMREVSKVSKVSKVSSSVGVEFLLTC